MTDPEVRCVACNGALRPFGGAWAHAVPLQKGRIHLADPKPSDLAAYRKAREVKA